MDVLVEAQGWASEIKAKLLIYYLKMVISREESRLIEFLFNFLFHLVKGLYSTLWFFHDVARELPRDLVEWVLR